MEILVDYTIVLSVDVIYCSKNGIMIVNMSLSFSQDCHLSVPLKTVPQFSINISPTASPFRDVAAAAKSGFNLLQNPHPENSIEQY